MFNFLLCKPWLSKINKHRKFNLNLITINLCTILKKYLIPILFIFRKIHKLYSTSFTVKHFSGKEFIVCTLPPFLAPNKSFQPPQKTLILGKPTILANNLQGS